MPEEGAPLSPKEHLLTADEVVKLASIFVSNGVRKIRLTGGEPTVRKDLPEIVGKHPCRWSSKYVQVTY